MSGINKLLVGAGLCLVSVAASASQITFDNGLNFQSAGFSVAGGNFGEVHCPSYFTQDTGYCRGLVSGDYTGYMEGVNTITKIGGGAFDFNSVYLTAAWNHNLTVQINGLVNGVVKYATTITGLNDDFSTLYTFDYLGITSLQVITSGGVDAGTPGGGRHVALDNVVLDGVPATAKVPVPGSLALVGLGMGLGYLRRRAG